MDLKDYANFVYQDTNKELGKKLKSARIGKGYTQIEAASLIGISNEVLCRLENGTYSKINEKTFLKLQSILSLDCEEFEPFIQKREQLKEGKHHVRQNKELIQKLVIEKRNDLHLSKEALGRKADVSSTTIRSLEKDIDRTTRIDNLLRIMYALEFDKEEILKCLPHFSEENLECEKEKTYTKREK